MIKKNNDDMYFELESKIAILIKLFKMYKPNDVYNVDIKILNLAPKTYNIFRMAGVGFLHQFNNDCIKETLNQLKVNLKSSVDYLSDIANAINEYLDLFELNKENFSNILSLIK